ncbi:MAG: hypothetical protein OEZ39_07585 [Gammaproteobacteria bacterium]|nr:hypothetical protein [Gammaproteobacteria bacterium]MDH5651720.1 hypothetical protein [Gammaproteobacteria bacterium]
MFFLFAVLTLLLIFIFGFYLGNQIGNSAHIRQDIEQARANHTVTGLHHLRRR